MPAPACKPHHVDDVGDGVGGQDDLSSLVAGASFVRR
jgi:hypothetical protein